MENLSSEQYFNILKNKKQVMTQMKLDEFYDNCLAMLERFRITGQIDGMKKIAFLAEYTVKEKQLLDIGITEYVHKYDIDDYIDNISDDDVSIIELSKYERIIPDDIIGKIVTCKDIFDEMYVLFTDYTSQHKRKIESERKNNDPILFGVFKSKRTFHDRFYIIGDWEDEYCHLTMEKFLADFHAKGKKVALKDIYTPEKLEELKKMLNKSKITAGDMIMFEDEAGSLVVDSES